jgi:hypothetical protein
MFLKRWRIWILKCNNTRQVALRRRAILWISSLWRRILSRRTSLVGSLRVKMRVHHCVHICLDWRCHLLVHVPRMRRRLLIRWVPGLHHAWLHWRWHHSWMHRWRLLHHPRVHLWWHHSGLHWWWLHHSGLHWWWLHHSLLHWWLHHSWLSVLWHHARVSLLHMLLNYRLCHSHGTHGHRLHLRRSRILRSRQLCLLKLLPFFLFLRVRDIEDLNPYRSRIFSFVFQFDPFTVAPLFNRIH